MGDVYKLIPLSTKTYGFLKPVKSYLLNALQNSEVADNIASHVFQISALLSQPSCRIIKPITIDYNFIEVLPKSFFFNIEKKDFEMNPRELKGSPRAFVVYTYDGVVPLPEPFVEGKKYLLVSRRLYS